VSHIAIDHPDEVIHWFACHPESERARPVIGDCPHACDHLGTTVVGWGPDLAHYELVICDGFTSGCEGNCRGWCAAPAGYDQLAAIDWKLLGTPA
jgi:hypothetical protein